MHLISLHCLSKSSLPCHLESYQRRSSMPQAQRSRAASTASCSALQSRQHLNSQQPQRSSSGKLASRPQWCEAERRRAEHQQPLQVAGLLSRTRAVMMAVRMPVVSNRMARKTVVPSAVVHQTVHSVACKRGGVAHQINVLHRQVLRLTGIRSHTSLTHNTQHDTCSRALHIPHGAVTVIILAAAPSCALRWRRRPQARRRRARSGPQ